MTQPGITAFLDDVRAELASLPGLRRAYEDVPDSVNEMPGIVVYARSGDWRLDTHGKGDGVFTFLGVHTVVIELYLPRKDLPREMALIEFFADALPVHLLRAFITNRFTQTLLNVGNPDTANNAVAPIRYRVVGESYAGQQHLNFELEFDVAIQQEVTPTP